MKLSRNLIAATTAIAVTGGGVRAAPPAIPIPATPAIAQAPDPTVASDTRARTTIVPGTEPAPVAPQIAEGRTKRGDITLNFPNADVQTVAAAVLGGILRRNYTIAQGVGGKVSLVTPGPVSRGSVFGLFEQALLRANLALVPVAGGYEIQNAATARGVVAPATSGFGSEVFTLRFINAEEVRKILDSILPGVVTAADPATGTITIAGTTGQRSSARDILRQFDVDWLRATSFSLYIPQRTDARLIVPSLEKLINAPDSPTRGLVRLITMEQLNGILAISTQPQYLVDVSRWIEILDREGESSERRIFVYRVQNGRARDLTRTINAAYGVGAAGSSGSGDPFTDRSAFGGPEPDPSRPPASPPPPVSGPQGGASGAPTGGGGGASGPAAGSGARVTADETNNAVLVLGTPREYAVIEDALRKLDVPPQQVLIEAAITEVSLTDDLRYGVQWNYDSGGHSVGFSEGRTSAPVQNFPGFSYFYGGSSISATLNALQQHTNVKVVSAPKLLVLNNQTAALQVGDQVPISTGTATNLQSSSSAIVSTIEYKDTGVILKITPRVNASGLVQLDVSQEVSQVVGATAGTATEQQSPTISTRRIATTVAVRDGEVIALGGLFSDTRTYSKRGIPFLSQIPVLGAVFGTHQNSDTRTELIVLLKPHVLAGTDDARAITDELRTKLRTLEPFRSTGRIP